MRTGRILLSVATTTMHTIATHFRSAAFVSLLFVLPFALLESLHTTLTRQNARGLALLFGFLWLLSLGFVLGTMLIVRNARTAHPVKLLLGAAVVLALAATWASLVADQMPCFLGVPNCD